MKNIIYLVALVFVLVACGTSNNGSGSAIKDSLPPPENQVEEGDFVYRLFTEKDVYDEFGDLAIFAELTYVGDEESIDIFHGGSAFHFPFVERTREFDVGYAMNEPLLTTTLIKDEPLREKYAFAGGYSDEDTEEFQQFVETIIEKGFPEGEYIMNGSAQFYLNDPAFTTNDKKYNMNASIGFTVVKGVK
ncbi:hypothetical protein [Sporosarcina jiandibaonis]|uniref:hypothetical protein n=1 Tax=Sporosarcina jiandibaonis TaxID=2715535 RepID=UPI001557727C|nr:hypothetical protein [Sporosarcina jiandibaonis]